MTWFRKWWKSLLIIVGGIFFIIDNIGRIQTVADVVSRLQVWIPPLKYFGLPPHILAWIGVFFIVAGIVSILWPYGTTDSVPNISCYKILRSGISWDDTNGCFVRKPDTQHPVYGIFLEIANEVEYGKPSPAAGRVKAQIIYHFRNKHELRAAPGAWIDEPLSSVELAPGDTRWLIVAVGFHYTQDWRVPFNRRSDRNNPVSFEYYDIPGLLGTRGTVDVQLLSLETNKILITWTLGWEWKPQYSFEITHFIQTKH